MSWNGIEAKITRVPVARGYRFELLQRREISALTAAVKAWFPEISIGEITLARASFRIPENLAFCLLIDSSG